MKVELTVKDNT